MATVDARLVEELNAAVHEYLKLNGHEETLSAFETELSAKGLPVQLNLAPVISSDNNVDYEKVILECFSDGKQDSFFTAWEKHVPDQILALSSDCQKLEFNLHIYFAIYPLLKDKVGHNGLERSMPQFKDYLESKGASLSQTPDFVMYYALPYVGNLREHPTFKTLFEEPWLTALENDLHDFLRSLIQPEHLSYIYRLHTSSVAKTSSGKEEYNDQIRELQRQVQEYEYRTTVYFRKYGKIQADYHTLIGIAAELVDALENAVKGTMVTPEYLQSICERLLNNSKTQSGSVMQSYVDSRPGTAASRVRSSLLGNLPKAQDNANVPYLPSLNYDKVKQDLLHLADHNKALLLQALRWRLTHSVPGEQRDAVVAAFISNDILGCALDEAFKDDLVQVMRVSEKVSCEQFARLFNALSSFSAGRAYISRSAEMVSVLIAMTKTDAVTSATSEHLLGALQKLSLRRSSQNVMIKQSMIPWLLDCLSNCETLSDYSTEYAVALLMNLCLRASGKIQCLFNPHKVIKLLTDLLAYNNQDIRPYVNGTLYSILALPTIRRKAIEMDLEEILSGFIDKNQPDMNRQIQFIIKQLNADIAMATDNPHSDDEANDDEDDEDEEGDAVDVELDRETSLSLRPDELHGEKLLARDYLGILSAMANESTTVVQEQLSEDRDDDMLFKRPVTPATVRLGQSRSAPAERGEKLNPSRHLSISSVQELSGAATTVPQTLLNNTPSKQMPKAGRRGPAATKSNVNAFTARPKIPRTPDFSSSGSPSRPGTSEPPLPTRSISPPRR